MRDFDPRLDLVIERFMRAEPEKVWAAWTTPKILEKWWVPHPAFCRVVELDGLVSDGVRHRRTTRWQASKCGGRKRLVRARLDRSRAAEPRAHTLPGGCG